MAFEAVLPAQTIDLASSRRPLARSRAPLSVGDSGESERLAAAAQGGDREAFGALVRRFAERVHHFLLARGLQDADARDVAQDAFIRAYQALDRYQPRFSFSTWLFTIAHRLAINRYHQRKPHVAIEHVESELATSPSRDDEPEVMTPPAGRVWDIAKGALSDKHFTALWLYYGEDQDMAQVASVLGITALHARVIVHRARAKLAKALTAAEAASAAGASAVAGGSTHG